MDIFDYARSHNTIGNIEVDNNGRAALFEDLQSVHSALHLIGHTIDYKKMVDELEKNGYLEIGNVTITC